MTQTIEQQKAEAERIKAIEALKAQRAAKAGELEKLDESIGKLEDADFHGRLGKAQLSKMSYREKSEVVSRLGAAKFLELIGAR